MFHSDLFIQIRAYIVLGLILLIWPIVFVITWLYNALELCARLRKFKSIRGELALITGAGHGLGRCIALLLAKHGCNVAIADINLEGAEQTVKLITSKYNVKCKAYKVDVSSYEEIEDLNNRIINELGVTTILINNAGIVALSNFAKPETQEIQRMINVNLVGHFWTNRVFLENMKKHGKGHIVAICSIAGMFPLVYNSTYTSTKFGLRGMMRSIRLELKAQGYTDIRTTTIFPSFLMTNSQVLEYSNKVDVGSFYPILKGEVAAEAVVHAMLRNELEVVIPRGFAILSRIFDSFPSAFQDTFIIIFTKSFVKKFQNIYNQHEEMIKKEGN